MKMAWKRMPTEVQELILCQVPNKSDVANLRRVSKHFQNTALRSLYRTIEIRAKDEWNLVDLSLDPLVRTLHEHPEYVNYIKNVCISAPVHQNVKYRCPHLYEGDSKYMEAFQEAYEEMDHQECEEGEYSKPSQDVFLSDLGSGVLALLHCLRDNHLSSFSWQLGTCIPSEVLGLSGQLLRKQNQIESLSLLTDTWCHLNNGIKQTNRTIPELIGFTSLQSISWRGIHSRSDFSALQGALQANSKHLKTLELDLVKWTSAEFYYHYKIWNRDKSQHFLAYEVLQLGTKGLEVTFPSLKALSLSGVSYHIAASEIASAFNFSKLRSLKLNKCLHIRNLLEAVLQASQPMRLTSLELAIEEGSLGGLSDPLIRFLASFEGLEVFNLLIHDNEISGELWKTILLHQSTLKQLVYHERPHNTPRTTDRLILPWDRIPQDTVLSSNPSLGLRYFGICCSLSDLDSRLGTLDKDALTFLHIRRTGIDECKRQMEYMGASSENRSLHDFAVWAFGPQGFPRLQVLAYGDFSYGNRYAQQNTLFRRRSSSGLMELTSFEVVRSDSWNRMDDMDAYLEVLEACPVDYLYS